jgi:hypothetical protein
MLVRPAANRATICNRARIWQGFWRQTGPPIRVEMNLRYNSQVLVPIVDLRDGLVKI